MRAAAIAGRHRLLKGAGAASLTTHTSRDSPSGALSATVTSGSTVYIAGAGPVGLAAAYSSQLLGAAAVIVGDRNADRLAQARSFGCETVDITQDASLEDQIAEILGVPEVDSAVDAVGFEASAPRLPRPRIAVPFEITATRLPFAV